jgi:hypothetical protein
MHTAWPHSKPTVASEIDVVVALERAHSVAFGHVAQILRVRGVTTPRCLGGRGRWLQVLQIVFDVAALVLVLVPVRDGIRVVVSPHSSALAFTAVVGGGGGVGSLFVSGKPC